MEIIQFKVKLNFVFLLCMLSILGLSGCKSTSNYLPFQGNAPLAHDTDNFGWQDNSIAIWNNLQHFSINQLQSLKPINRDQAAWIQLALISRDKHQSTAQLVDNLMAWRAQYPDHPANSLFPDDVTLDALKNNPKPQQLAILLPKTGIYTSAAASVREGLLRAYYANLTHTGKQNIRFYDTAESKKLPAIYAQAIDDGADFVIGPLIKDSVETLQIQGNFAKPTLALNYTLGSQTLTNWYEFGLLPEDEISQMIYSARASKLSKAIVIAPRNAWGQRLTAGFNDEWLREGGIISETWFYDKPSDFSTDIAKLLKIDTTIDKKLMKDDNNKTVLEQQRRQDFDVIFLFSQPQQARLIVPLLRYYYANNIPLYATSTVYAGQSSQLVNVDLHGIKVCDIPWQENKLHGNTAATRLFAIGQDAYLISENLERLTKLANFPLYGKTGALILTQDQKIHRRIPCFRIGQ